MESILIIVTDSLYHNNSACLAHAAYVKGFCDNGYRVRVVMPDCEDADKDPAIVLPQEAEYLIFSEKNPFSRFVAKSVKNEAYSTKKDTLSLKVRRGIRGFLSRVRQRFLKISNKGLFPNSAFFIKEVLDNSSRFTDCDYRYIISLSSPVAAHYLAELVVKKTQVRYDKWIQIWEDPWYYDLYTKKDRAILNEEFRLLSLADLVEYVTPLTCHYQKQYFPEFANKMFWSFLPYNVDLFCTVNSKHNTDVIKIGYFGEYVSTVRNIMPLVEAVDSMTDFELLICGRSDLDLSSFKHVRAKGRVSVEMVNKYQSECDCLINVSNLKGGQIPGKIYQYAATDKTILFILDGTEEEKTIILETFKHYNRFVFCENDKSSISEALIMIKNGELRTVNRMVSDFVPKSITKIIESHANNKEK